MDYESTSLSAYVCMLRASLAHQMNLYSKELKFYLEWPWEKSKKVKESQRKLEDTEDCLKVLKKI